MRALYNRYVSQGATWDPVDPPPDDRRGSRPRSGGGGGGNRPPQAGRPPLGLLSNLGGEKIGQTISSLLERFHLDSLDSGDLLLILIVLFLLKEEGDNLDLLIALALLFLLPPGDP